MHTFSRLVRELNGLSVAGTITSTVPRGQATTLVIIHQLASAGG